MNRSLVLLPILLLAACDERGGPTRVTINADRKAENSAEARGFHADINIPGVSGFGGTMDFDGVKFYPATKVSGVDVKAGDGQDQRVALQFQAPGRREEVAAWFTKQFADNRFNARTTPTGFAGKTADGNWFVLDLTENGAGRTSGALRLGQGQH